MFNGQVVGLDASVWLVKEPAELLEDLCVVGLALQDAVVGVAGGNVVLGELVGVADLVPEVLDGEGRGGVMHDVVEALEVGGGGGVGDVLAGRRKDIGEKQG